MFLLFLEDGDCFEGDGSNYQGQASTTVSGKTCLVWSSVYDFLPSNNYCRNYFSAYGVTEPVCYYQPGSYYVEPCGLPKCGNIHILIIILSILNIQNYISLYLCIVNVYEYRKHSYMNKVSLTY